MTLAIYQTQNVPVDPRERILELEVIDKENQFARQYKGGNKLHAHQDAGLWSLKFEHGELPEPLRTRYTGFNQLMKHVTTFFKMRGVEVKEVR